jgi:type II secretory pathway component PulL
VSRGLSLGRGSKRRIRQIRWKRKQVVSLIVLMLLALVVTAYIAVWYEFHHTD